MPYLRLPLLCSLALAVTACGAEQQTDVATADAPAANPVPAKAMLSAKQVAGAPDVAIPEVSGIDARAAGRINATLAAIRTRGVEAAAACRTDAGAQPFVYRLTAQPAYNDRGLLSVRVTGDAACGGAHGNTIAEAHTFDLASGAEVDVVAATGQSAAKLAALAVEGYQGEDTCKAFIAGDRASLGSAFLTDQGVGVNYTVNVGAAQSCTAHPGLAPWEGLTSRLKAPLTRVATGPH